MDEQTRDIFWKLGRFYYSFLHIFELEPRLSILLQVEIDSSSLFGGTFGQLLVSIQTGLKWLHFLYLICCLRCECWSGRRRRIRRQALDLVDEMTTHEKNNLCNILRSLMMRMAYASHLPNGENITVAY
ncbi:hypothetical protein Tsp_03727 [Trichinella spiralis]|uniref:hypothetical protein n=1 Tax=Trichinella spiralis TaxID=6334 RepID=UPI0001EFBB0E|nr:hypothetical protein Tsp_03727 [Trichinella spiralis]